MEGDAKYSKKQDEAPLLNPLLWFYGAIQRYPVLANITPVY
jgi:hypothetical protein